MPLSLPSGPCGLCYVVTFYVTNILRPQGPLSLHAVFGGIGLTGPQMTLALAVVRAPCNLHLVCVVRDSPSRAGHLVHSTWGLV